MVYRGLLIAFNPKTFWETLTGISNGWIRLTVCIIFITYNFTSCAANFSFAQLSKRKSLGRSKPATNSQAQALQHTVWNVSTISKPY
jgi:hypothetical protein